ncbi:MAG TPA: hypothetical protein VHT74_18640 [Acetobacteraceae bacterium]|jgi:hypothetical protein|nr:hypothetical protein [Acetobacteraceae bacterium]
MTIKVGSEAHKELFCRQFLETHELYDPAVLPWPDLDDAQLERLRSVPFWQEVYHTERRAGAIVAAFTPMVEDPLVREAVALQGVEEARHAQLLRVMIDRYGLDAAEQPLETLPANLETAFIDFGFGECMDSFLGFGAFKTARQSEFLPEGMFEIFDVLMHEETRHIVFFINYMAWREVRRGRGAAPLRALTSAWYYGRALSRLLGMVRRGKDTNDGKDFAITEANVFLEGFSFRQFVEDCYRENGRRMGAFDPNLLQPRLLPAIANMAVAGLRTWERRRPHLRRHARLFFRK